MRKALFAVVFMAVTVLGGLFIEPVSAQNSNSSTTMGQRTDDMRHNNMGRRRRRRMRRHWRRHMRRSMRRHNMNANT